MSDYTSIGYILGFIGLGFGILVPLPQLIQMKRTGSFTVNRWTYLFLITCLSFYLYHAIFIGSLVFMLAQSINLTTNGLILGILIKRRRNAS